MWKLSQIYDLNLEELQGNGTFGNFPPKICVGFVYCVYFYKMTGQGLSLLTGNLVWGMVFDTKTTISQPLQMNSYCVTRL